MAMHHLLLLCFLTIVIQQVAHVQSFVIPALYENRENWKLHPNQHFHVTRYLDPSLSLSDPTNADYADFINHELYDNPDKDDMPVRLSKRRQGVPLFGRRWVPEKRRGPLYG